MPPPNPKQLWLLENAGHVDMLRFAGMEYKNRLMDFLARYLN